MDKIIVTAKIIKDERNASPDLCVMVEISDRALVDHEHDRLGVDLTELAKTLINDGEFFIITCSCGDPGCAGITEGVHVTRDQSTLHWLIPSNSKGTRKEQTFAFSLEDYNIAVKHGITQFMQLYEENPHIETNPYLLRDRIEFAKEQNWLSQWLAV